MTAASPIRLAGPASIIEAVPYLLGFDPADSLVLVGLRDGQLTLTARVDLDDLDRPSTVTDLMNVLAGKAESTDVVAITYGDRDEAESIAAGTAAHGMRLLEHLQVAEGRYWSLSCPIEGCCPAEGRAVVTDNAVAAELVGLGASKTASREDLAAIFCPVENADRLLPLIHAAGQIALTKLLAGHNAARVTSDKRALFAAAPRETRDWSDKETPASAQP